MTSYRGPVALIVSSLVLLTASAVDSAERAHHVERPDELAKDQWLAIMERIAINWENIIRDETRYWDACPWGWKIGIIFAEGDNTVTYDVKEKPWGPMGPNFIGIIKFTATKMTNSQAAPNKNCFVDGVNAVKYNMKKDFLTPDTPNWKFNILYGYNNRDGVIYAFSDESSLLISDLRDYNSKAAIWNSVLDIPVP